MYDQSEWEELQRHNDIFARWNYECQTELERWHIFLESKYNFTKPTTGISRRQRYRA